MDPKTGPFQGANEEVFAMTSTDQVIATDKHANTGTSLTNVMAHTPEVHACLSNSSNLMTKNTAGNEFTNHLGQNKNKEISLPTPISVQTLEEALSLSPRQRFCVTAL